MPLSVGIRSSTLKTVGARILAAARSADPVEGYDNDDVRALAEAMCDGNVALFERLSVRVDPAIMENIRWSLSNNS